ncbi:unnamed protein product, partial [marine sediment metagenome]
KSLAICHIKLRLNGLYYGPKNKDTNPYGYDRQQ